MRAIVDGLERFANIRKPNGIECDRCKTRLNFERGTPALPYARFKGWVCEGEPRVDLCPSCGGSDVTGT